MATSTSAPALESSPQQVRDFITSLLRRKYILDEAEIAQVAGKWRHGGNEYHQFDLMEFRQVFGLVYGTILWCDEHRVTDSDKSLLKVDLPSPKTGRKTQWISASIYSAVGLWVLKLASDDGSTGAWIIYGMLEVCLLVIGIFVFRVLEPDVIPLRHVPRDMRYQDDMVEEGKDGGVVMEQGFP